MPRRFQPRRPLGRTGFEVTALGQGDLADRTVPREQGVAVLRRALDAGVNLIDTAPKYEDGLSEELVGQALRGRRDGIFLVDKIDHLDRPVAGQLDGSLERLGLPAVDLLAFHGVSRLDDWERLAAPGGLMDELGNEVRRGRVRYRGLSSHHPDVLHAALDDGRCDVLLFPLGLFVARQYVTEILPRAREAGIGTIGFKTFGAGKLLGDTEGYGRPLTARPDGPAVGLEGAAPALPRLDVTTCLRYTLTLDPDVALLGLSTEAEQDAAWEAAEAFVPMPPQEQNDARRAAWEAIKDKGAVWWNPPPRLGR